MFEKKVALAARVGFASAAMLLAAVVQMHSELALPQLPGGAARASTVTWCKKRSICFSLKKNYHLN